ncbi:MAG: hypothetical protein WC882_01300 [Candidatus Gracilibacteria bacterium]
MSYPPLHGETNAATTAGGSYTRMSTVDPNIATMAAFEPGAIALYTGLEQADPTLREPPALAHEIRHTRQRFEILGDIIATAADPRTADMLRLSEAGIRRRLERQAQNELHAQNLATDMPWTRFLGEDLGTWTREMAAFWNAGARLDLLRGPDARTDHWIRQYVNTHFRGQTLDTLAAEDRRMVLEETGLLANNFVAFNLGPLQNWAQTEASGIARPGGRPAPAGAPAAHLSYAEVLRDLNGGNALRNEEMIPILRLLQTDPTYGHDLEEVYAEVMAHHFSDEELGLGHHEQAELKQYQDAVARVEDLNERYIGIQNMSAQITGIATQLAPLAPGVAPLGQRVQESLQNQLHNLTQKRDDAVPILSKLVGQYNRTWARLTGFTEIAFTRTPPTLTPNGGVTFDIVIQNLEHGAEQYRTEHEQRRTPHQLLYELHLHHFQHPPAAPGGAPGRVMGFKEAQKRAVISTMLLMDMVESDTDEGYAVRRARQLARGRVGQFFDRTFKKRLPFEHFVKKVLLKKDEFKELEGFGLTTRAEKILEWVHSGKLKEEHLPILIQNIEALGQDQLLGKGKLQLGIDVRPLVDQLTLAWTSLRAASDILKDANNENGKILAELKAKAGSLNVPSRKPGAPLFEWKSHEETQNGEKLTAAKEELEAAKALGDKSRVTSLERYVSLLERFASSAVTAEILYTVMGRIPHWWRSLRKSAELKKEAKRRATRNAPPIDMDEELAPAHSS